MPIVKVYSAEGRLVHSCSSSDCQVSWDGYVLVPGYTGDTVDPDTGQVTSSTPLAQGDRVPGASDPGPEWDTSTPGVARRIG